MPTNVHTIIQTLTSGLKELESHLEHLNRLFGGWDKTSPGGRKAAAAGTRKRGARSAPPKALASKKTRKKPRISAALRAQRRIQGRYMALIRRLPKSRQAAVKKVRETKGYPAALKMMR